MEAGSGKPKILIYRTEEQDAEDGLSLACCQLLGEHFDLVLPEAVETNPDIRTQIVGAVIRKPWQPMMARLLQDMPNVKVVCAMGVGVNHIDFEACKSRGIMVGNNPQAVTVATADFAMAQLLVAARQIVKGVTLTRAGSGLELDGKDVSQATLGIVGLGRIGSEIARRAQGFDMKVLYHNRNRSALESEVNAEYCPTLHEMLPRCDFVALSCPLTLDTRGMFRTEEFTLMKDDAILVSIARGAVIDTDALVDALQRNLIRCVVLDNTHPDKLPRDHPLLGMENALLTPRWGSTTPATTARISAGLLANLRSVLYDGGRPVYEASPEV